MFPRVGAVLPLGQTTGFAEIDKGNEDFLQVRAHLFVVKTVCLEWQRQRSVGDGAPTIRQTRDAPLYGFIMPRDHGTKADNGFNSFDGRHGKKTIRVAD